MANCDGTSRGLIPLCDLTGSYKGFPGYLYPGSNSVPLTHEEHGIAAGAGIQPLDFSGQPSETGKEVLLALGMSNVRREFAYAMRLIRGSSFVSRYVAPVNGAKGGYDAKAIADPTSAYWPLVDARLDERGLSPLQVQAVWLKEAVSRETDPFPDHVEVLKGYLRSVVLVAGQRFPNLKQIFFSSRVYGGYASTPVSPEPWAYEGGFAVKWLIESQISGVDPALAYDAAPWLAWGPYLWADGLNARSDGLTWECSDFEDDGTHPALGAEQEVAERLLDHLITSTTTEWFRP